MTESRSEYDRQKAEARYEALYGPQDFPLDEETIDAGLRCLTHAGGRWEGHNGISPVDELEPVCSEVWEGHQGGAEPCRFERST